VRILRKIFGPKKEEVAGGWRRLQRSGELHNRVIKSRRMRWAGHVARTGEMRNAYEIVIGKPEGKRPLERLRTRMYPKVSGLAAWSKNCRWYSFPPLGALVSLFVSQSSEFCRHNPLCCFSTSVYCCQRIFRYRLSPETFRYTLVYGRIRLEWKIGREGVD
jgi:hypothetical protein